MKIKAISLFSGGLDSILAAKMILDLGIEVLGVTFETPFFSARNALTASKQIGLPLTIINITDDYLEMLKSPKYGFGKNMNPCIDCHTLMLNIAGKKMEEIGANFIFTGEVLGQRPMSQTKQSLHIVAKNSGYQEYILRPLCAQLLPETKAEMEGKVDRQSLLAIHGRGRQAQLKLAKRYGVTDYAAPAGGCLLTDPMFSRRLRDLFSYREINVRNIELLKYGRHFRLDNISKVIVGRKKADNEAIESLSEEKDTMLHVVDYPGPTTLIPSGCSNETLSAAAALCVLYSDAPKDKEIRVMNSTGKTLIYIKTKAAEKEDAHRWII